MQEIPIGEVKEGQKLAQSVSDGSGKRLVERGVEVSDTLLRVLQRRGIESVFIEEKARNTKNPEQDPIVIAQREAMGERLVLGFQKHVENPTMAVLYKTAHDYLYEKILQEAAK